MIMTLPLVCLAVFSIFFGMLFHNFFAGINVESLWSNFMHIDSETQNSYAIGDIPKLIKKMPLIMIFSGITIVLLIYFKLSKILELFKEKIRFVISFFYNKFFIDELYDFILVKPCLYLGKGFWKSIDNDLIDNLGPNGMSRLIGSFGLD